jgi:hypothetical protein
LLKTTGNPNRRIGPSNRDVPDDARIVVSYVPGETLQVRWAIDDGAPPLPTGEATCTSPPTTTTTTTLPDGETTTTTTTTTLPDGETTTTTTVPPGPLTTALLARREARTIINVLGAEIRAGRLDVDGVQLVGTYPIAGADTDDVDVVQVFYTNADVDDSWPYTEAFSAPPAAQVQCLNPAFD